MTCLSDPDIEMMFEEFCIGEDPPGGWVSFDIPKGMIGKVIGKGGSTIKSLQSKSGARMHVEESKVKIMGDPSQVKTAKKLLNELIGKTKVVTIGHNQIGAVIGAKGFKIKSIQEISGAKLSIIEQSGGKNADARVEIRGSEKQIKAAEKLIGKTISTAVAPLTEMTIVGSKLYLKQLDAAVKLDDLVNIYPDAHIAPKKIVIRVEKGGIGKYAALTFATPANAIVWQHQMNGKMLSGRRITFQK